MPIQTLSLSLSLRYYKYELILKFMGNSNDLKLKRETRLLETLLYQTLDLEYGSYSA